MATLIKLLAVFVTFAMFACLAQVLSVDDFGRFSFGFSLATVASLIAGLGLNSVILRFWPQYQEQGREWDAESISRWTKRWTWSLAGAASATLVGAILSYGRISPETPITYLYAAALLTGLMVVGQYYSGLMRARGFVVQAFVPFDVAWRALVATAAGLCLWKTIALNAGQALWLCVGALSAIVVYQTILADRLSRRDPKPNAPPREKGAASSKDGWWRVALYLGATSVLFVIPRQVDVIILGVVLSPDATGPYFAALRSAGMLAVFAQAANAIGAPQLARAYHGGRREDVPRIAHRLVIEVSLQSAAVFAFMFILGRFIMEAFGPEYSASTPVLWVLGASFLFSNLTGPTYRLLSMTGHEREYLVWLAVGHGLGIALKTVVLLAGSGIFAFACTSALVSIAINISIVVLTRQKLHFDPTLVGALRRNGVHDDS